MVYLHAMEAYAELEVRLLSFFTVVPGSVYAASRPFLSASPGKFRRSKADPLDTT
jgi:hypothetical protein